MQDMTIVLENTPGSLAQLGETLGGAGVNIEGGCAINDESGSVVHILVEDPGRARSVLTEAGFRVEEEQPALAFYVSGDDRPGIIGRYARRIADAGVNIERMYVAAGSRLAFVTDDHAGARAAVRG
jgi:hypothetical protein